MLNQTTGLITGLGKIISKKLEVGIPTTIQSSFRRQQACNIVDCRNLLSTTVPLANSVTSSLARFLCYRQHTNYEWEQHEPLAFQRTTQHRGIPPVRLAHCSNLWQESQAFRHTLRFSTNCSIIGSIISLPPATTRIGCTGKASNQRGGASNGSVQLSRGELPRYSRDQSTPTYGVTRSDE